MKLLVYTDGGARGNPGPAGCGVFIVERSEERELAHSSDRVMTSKDGNLGACSQNSKSSILGIRDEFTSLIEDEGYRVVEKRFKYIGEATNNIAEYTGAFLGITRAIELGATEIELRADSKLVIEQLSGNYKVKNPELKKIFLEIQDRIGKWGGKISFTHIYREQNTEADRLSNVAMDKRK